MYEELMCMKGCLLRQGKEDQDKDVQFLDANSAVYLPMYHMAGTTGAAKV